ncbi:MAG: redoxin domain-containing protein [Deltaproteobacteria bacterium]|nr:MAG: redoxin domain-containing protein [Deltaproteobacteria bacterium]
MKSLSKLVLVAVAALWVGCASAPDTTAPPSSTDLGAVQLTDLVGGRHTLSEYQGKVVLLDFWATWCAPCVASLPLYDRWQQELGPQGFVVVAASVDEEDAPVADFAVKYAPNITVMRDAEGAAAGQLGLPKMPTAFLIGRDGRLIERHAGFDDAGAATLRDRIMAALASP